MKGIWIVQIPILGNYGIRLPRFKSAVLDLIFTIYDYLLNKMGTIFYARQLITILFNQVTRGSILSGQAVNAKKKMRFKLFSKTWLFTVISREKFPGSVTGECQERFHIFTFNVTLTET